MSMHNSYDDWGWYVDIETNNINPCNTTKANKIYTILETIKEEDDYSYHMNNYKNNNLDYFCKKTNETIREEYDDSFLHEIWFSTCVTILITSALLISYNLY